MKKNSFVEGTIIATIAIVLVKTLGMLYIIPFYATVGSKGSALYGYAYNIYNIFLEISAAGLPIAMSKIINEYNTLGMSEAKVRAFKIGKKLITYISLFCFVILFVFAREIGTLILGNLSGGNTIEDVAFVIRCVSFAVLIIPFLSITKGYLQGHKYIGPTSVSLIIEQVIRIVIIILGSYLALKVFDLGLTNAVGVAVFGAFIGGVAAYLYIAHKMRKNKKALGFVKYEKKDAITDKEILKKIIYYAVPFIIINIAVTVYSFTNMVLILRTLNYLNIYSATEVEFITNAITTLGTKLNMIVGALATGLTISLIPNIVSSYVKKDMKDVERKINKAFQIVLVISIPMTVALSIMAKPVWTAFYGVSTYGPIIFRVSIFTALFANLYMVSGSTLQGLNKFKAVYLSTLIGFFVNALLDVPLMYGFYKLGLYPFYGALLSTIIGYSLSVIIGLKYLKKVHEINIKETVKVFIKILVPTIAMVLVLLLIKYFVPYNVDSRLSSVLFIILNTLIGSVVYLFIATKMGLMKEIFGQKMIAKIVKKATFGLIKLKED
ncbi:MAG TPA: polysaccharide biosynthesis protein [Bacilli bacterium]|nr:polysaccharide biosynthesis protein [Bacilli bacterium]